MTPARRDHPHVQIGERHAEQTYPCPKHMVLVELRDTAPRVVSRIAAPNTREAVDVAADEVPQRMATERIEREQRRAERQHQRTDAHPECVPASGYRPDVRNDRVISQDRNE